MEQSDGIHLSGTTLRQHRHLCAFFRTVDERYRVLLPFVKEGIERGEKAIHIVDPARQMHLRTDGIDVRGHRRPVIWRGPWVGRAYLPGGTFDPNATLALMSRS